MLTFNISSKTFHKYRQQLISCFFGFIIKKRIENRVYLRLFYILFSFVNRFYYEQPFKKENHHYIPQFILRNFAIPGTGCIYEYSLNSLNPKRISIKKEAASVVNFYSFNKYNSGGYSNFTEKNVLSEIIEKYSSKVIKNIVESRFDKLISLEENMLSHYAAFQYTRTPAFHLQLRLFLLFLIENKNLDLKYFTNKYKYELMDVVINNKLEVDIYEFKKYFYNENHIDIYGDLSKYLDNSNHVVLLLSNTIANHIIEPLFRKKIYILESFKPLYFMMPDTGVLVFDFKDSNNLWPYGWDFSKNSMSLMAPLSPNKCIIFTNSEINAVIREEYIKLGVGSVYYQKLKYIYSDRNDSAIQKNIFKHDFIT